MVEEEKQSLHVHGELKMCCEELMVTRVHLSNCGGLANASALFFLFGHDVGDNFPYPSFHADHLPKDSQHERCQEKRARLSG